MARLPARVSDALLSDKLWLALATTTAVVITALGDVPEKVPFGHELGIFVSAFAYAYVGAWIFNWVIVTRPRSAQLRDIYRVTWRALSVAAWDGYYLVRDLQYLADADPRVEPADEDIQALCRRITYGRSQSGENPVAYINGRLELRNTLFGAASPLLAYAEHDVLVAIAQVNNSSLIIAPMPDHSENGEPAMVHRSDGPPYAMTLANEANGIEEYFLRTELLRLGLKSLKYAPGLLIRGVAMSNTQMWADDKIEKYSLGQSCRTPTRTPISRESRRVSRDAVTRSEPDLLEFPPA
jgi:hypothetical protein